MAQDDVEYQEGLGPLLDPWRARAKDDIFADLRVSHDDEKTALVSGLRRGRKRATNAGDGTIKTVSLVKKGGILVWQDDLPAPDVAPPSPDIGRRQRRLRRRAGFSDPVKTNAKEIGTGPVMLAKTFPALQPNKVVEAVGKIDVMLNPALTPSPPNGLETLDGRLRRLRASDGKFVLESQAAGEAFSGRTLLFVHGTFSNATNMLGEFNKTPQGQAFLNNALSGPNKYDRVLFFEHATLAVSPVINALELGRLFANASGQIDVIAHSRGGLVVRWWLEAFGKSLNLNPANPVRAMLAGSPINGTSLAAPARLQDALNLFSNIAAYAQTAMGLVGLANPFMWAAEKLVEVVVSATGALARTPLLDGVIVLVPGLAGQAKVTNNHEINRLRLGPCAVTPRYFAVTADFETEEVGWKFWQYFRPDVAADVVTNAIFKVPNDLVVDTSSMTDFGVDKLGLAADPRHFGPETKVWHCNYFRQPETIAHIIKSFT